MPRRSSRTVPGGVCVRLKLLEPVTARRDWTGSCRQHALEWNLRRAIRVQESVGFLVGVGELGITKAREQSERTHGREQPLVEPRELLCATRDAITPGRAVGRRERNAAELGQHQRLFD